MTDKDPPKSDPVSQRSLFWPGIGIAALIIAYAAYRLFIRYGASDVTQAETIVYGMLLFIIGIVVAAFLAVMFVKLMTWLFGRRRSFYETYDDADKPDPADEADDGGHDNGNGGEGGA